MSAIVVKDTPFWEMVSRLREFEGRRCLWRVPFALVLFAAVPLLLLAFTVLGAAISAGGFDLTTAIVSAAIVLSGTGLLAPLLARRRLHRNIVAVRLWSWEKPNPVTEVQVIVAEDDAHAARLALRRRKFNPGVYGVKLGSPPPDAPDLTFKLGVHEPEAWPQSTSDEDRTWRIVDVLDRAGIRARVGGIDAGAAGEA